MSFPSTPSNGDKYTKDNADIYTYASATNAWTLSGHTGSLGNIFISALEQFRVIDYTQGTSQLNTQYCFTVGNFVYTPVFYTNNGIDPATVVVGMMKISIDSSVLTSLVWGASYSGTAGTNAISSQYLDGSVCYFNSSSSFKYHYYNTANDSWVVKQTGAYTAGTQITAPLQLSGYKYEQVWQQQNYSTYTFCSVKTKVTKV